VPSAAEAYVHRIGRTGRAGRTGVAITLAEPREHRMLRNIERVTGQVIETLNVPTVADLKARRLEAVQSALREVILAGDLDPWRGIVATLAAEFDVLDIAAAAVRKASTEEGADEEEEIPVAVAPRERHREREREPAGGARRTSSDVKPRGKVGGARAKLYFGAGRKAKLRPGDIVGAIVNEMKMDPTDIGAISIWDRHSIVEVPEAIADEIVRVLGATSVKGKRILVRRDRVK
jgi:ATP-dependent RNA helicase DeaD